MADSADDLLLYGIAAAKANSRDEARNYLEWVLRTDSTYDQQADAWYWLSTITDDQAEKRSCLENVLAIAPAYPEARRDLAIIDGRLRRDQLVDPTREVAPVTPQQNLTEQDLRSFKCPSCGAHMTPNALTGALVCGFCGYRADNASGAASAHAVGVKEQDWAAAIFSVQGHRWEVPTSRSFSCAQCGARVLVPASQVSVSCPFCGNPQVVQSKAELELLEPTGMLRFNLQALQAVSAITAWLRSQQFAPEQLKALAVQSTPHPIYLPAWTFDLDGSVRWTGAEATVDLGRVKVVRTSGSVPVVLNDVLVPGSKSQAASKLADLQYDLSKLIPYSVSLLASWPAEIYSISPVDASLDARDHALQEARSPSYIKENVSALLEDVVVGGFDMSVISYKLLLLPVWIGAYSFEGRTHQVFVNGHSGYVTGDIPRNVMQRMLNQLLG